MAASLPHNCSCRRIRRIPAASILLDTTKLDLTASPVTLAPWLIGLQAGGWGLGARGGGTGLGAVFDNLDSASAGAVIVVTVAVVNAPQIIKAWSDAARARDEMRHRHRLAIDQRDRAEQDRLSSKRSARAKGAPPKPKPGSPPKQKPARPKKGAPSKPPTTKGRVKP
jgi:hypothetical protein